MEPARPDTPPDSALTKEERIIARYEEDVLYDQVLSTGLIKFAALFSYPEGKAKAANFGIGQKGIDDIIAALQGNTLPIAESGIVLGDGLPVFIPGKLDAGKAIFGARLPCNEATEPEGGCLVLKTNKYVLVTTYDDDNLISATRISRQVVQNMIQNGK